MAIIQLAQDRERIPREPTFTTPTQVWEQPSTPEPTPTSPPVPGTPGGGENQDWPTTPLPGTPSPVPAPTSGVSLGQMNPICELWICRIFVFLPSLPMGMMTRRRWDKNAL